MFRYSKSLILFIASVAFFSSFCFGDIIGTNFSAKLSGENSSNYRTSLSGVSLGDFIDFKFTSVLTGTKNYTGYINFNNNFSESSSSLEGTCNSSFLSETSFLFSGNGSECYLKGFFTYKIDGEGENTVDSFVENRSYYQSVDVNVSTNISIQNAYTKDYDNDGFLDGYRLIFSSGFDEADFDISKLTVSLDGKEAENLSFSGKDGKEVQVSYKDNLWKGGRLPQVELEGYSSGGTTFSNVKEEDVSEVDEANPVVYKVNGVKVIDENGNSLTGEIDINKNDNINIHFSEPMREKTVYDGIDIQYSDGTSINGTWTKQSDKVFAFNPGNDLSDDVEVRVHTTALDLSSNGGNSVNYIVFRLNLIDSSSPYGEDIGGISTGLLLEGGADETLDKQVDISFAAVDTGGGVDEMIVSNYSDFSNSKTYSYQEEIKGWELLSGTGQKTVYVKFKDYAGNTSSNYSDSIIYEYSPSFVKISQTGPFYTSGNNIFLTGNYSHTSGYSNLEYSIDNIGTGEIFTGDNKIWSGSFGSIDSDGTYSGEIYFKDDKNINTNFYIVRDTTVPNLSADPEGGTYQSEQEVSLSMNERGKIYYSFTGGEVMDNGNLYNRSFVVDNTISLYISGIDKAGNIGGQIYDFEFQCDPSSVSNGSVSGYPECEISCDSGYHKEGEQCVEDEEDDGGGGGGGGGGSYTPTCRDYHLTCQGGVYYRKEGVSCKGGLLGEFCKEYEDEKESTGDGEISDEKGLCRNLSEKEKQELAEKSFGNLKTQIISDSHKSLESVYSKILEKIYNKSETLLWQAKISNKSKSFKIKYFCYLRNFFDNVNLYKTKDKNVYKQLAKKYLKEFISLKKEVNQYREDLYTIENGIYQSNQEDNKEVLDSLEKKLFKKVDKLRENEQITQSQYKSFKEVYNKFVFVVLTKGNWTSSAKDFAIQQISVIVEIYKMRLKEKEFKEDLKIGDRGENVRKIQNYLSSHGYWPSNIRITGYFGNITLSNAKDYLKSEYNYILQEDFLSKEILNRYFIE